MSRIEKNYGEEMVFIAQEYKRLRRDQIIALVILAVALIVLVIGLWQMAAVNFGVGSLLGVISLVLAVSSLVIIVDSRPRFLRLSQIRSSTSDLLSELAFYGANLKIGASLPLFGNDEHGRFKVTKHHEVNGWIIESFASEALGGLDRRIFAGVVMPYRVDLADQRNVAMPYSLETVQHLEGMTQLIKSETGFDASMSDIEYARGANVSEDVPAEPTLR